MGVRNLQRIYFAFFISTNYPALHGISKFDFHKQFIIFNTMQKEYALKEKWKRLNWLVKLCFILTYLVITAAAFIKLYDWIKHT
jgi:uncharacterized membrane protein